MKISIDSNKDAILVALPFITLVIGVIAITVASCFGVFP